MEGRGGAGDAVMLRECLGSAVLSSTRATPAHPGPAMPSRGGGVGWGAALVARDAGRRRAAGPQGRGAAGPRAVGGATLSRGEGRGQAWRPRLGRSASGETGGEEGGPLYRRRPCRSGAAAEARCRGGGLAAQPSLAVEAAALRVRVRSVRRVRESVVRAPSACPRRALDVVLCDASPAAEASQARQARGRGPVLLRRCLRRP